MALSWRDEWLEQIMPELPEVQTTATSLQPLLNAKVKQIDVFQPQLRWRIPDNLSDLVTYQLKQIERRAKYLILTFTNQTDEKKLLIHLGMSGSLQQHPTGFEKRKHDHVMIHFDNQLQLHYHDPRRFGAILWLDDYQDKLLNHLGIEPLDNAFTGEYLYKKIHNQNHIIKKPIKSLIMEQQIVVGVGNIYATESLFLAKIHPLTPANHISLENLQVLVKHIKDILQKAIVKGGTTLKDFTTGEGKTGYFQQTLLVYGHHGEPCPMCKTPIDNVKINQRASTFCPNCQPLVEN